MNVDLYLKTNPNVQDQISEGGNVYPALAGYTVHDCNSKQPWHITLPHLPGKLPGTLTADDITHVHIHANGVLRKTAPMTEGIYEEGNVYATVEVYKVDKDLCWSLRLEASTVEEARDVLTRIRRGDLSPTKSWEHTAA